MKKRPRLPFGSAAAAAQAGFTIVELIGVLAIIAIMAAVIAPNAIKAIDRAAVRAEGETLQRLGEQARQFLGREGFLPGTNGAAWSADLATFADLSESNVASNPRSNPRLYILGPVNADGDVERVVILSSMRTGLALPTTNSAQVAAIWPAKDADVPALLGWSSWTASPTYAEDYLVIQRVNVAALQRRYLLVLNNVSGASTTVAGSFSTLTGTPLAPGNSTGNNGNSGNGNGNNGNGNGNGGSNTGSGSNTGGGTSTGGGTNTGGSGTGATTEQASYYRLTHRDRSVEEGTLLPSFSVQLKAHSGAVLELYDAPGGALVYVHKVTDSDRNFQFLPSHHWIAQ